MTSPEANDLPKLVQIESLAARAYSTIREGIATGVFVPSERVTERGLAARLGVSPTPVREAIRRLEHEGLIERHGARQLRVVDHSPESLRELMHAEVVLRAAQARFATNKLSADAIHRMTDIVDELERRLPLGEPAEQLEWAPKFDEEIVAAADNSALETIIASVSIFGQERRVRSVEAMRREPGVMKERIAAHRRILEAVQSGNGELVEQAMRAHLSDVVEFLLRIG